MLCIYNRNQEAAEFLSLPKEGSACSRPIAQGMGVEGVNLDSLTYPEGPK